MKKSQIKMLLSMGLITSCSLNIPIFATNLSLIDKTEDQLLIEENFSGESLLESEVFSDTVNGEKSAVIPVEGKSLPILIKADVPLAIPFSINPNEKDESKRFVSPEVSIRNLTSAPVKVEVVSLSKSTPDAPEIVDEGKYSSEEWNSLGMRLTSSNIAFGLKPTIGSAISFSSFYFAPEANQNPIVLSNSLGVNDSIDFELMSKHGLSWEESKEFSYDLHVRLSLTQ